MRTDHNAPSAAHPHTEYAALQAGDDLSPAQLYAQRLALVIGTPKLIAPVEVSTVMKGDDRAALGAYTGPESEVLNLHARGYSPHLLSLPSLLACGVAS